MKSKNSVGCSRSPTTSSMSSKLIERANFGILANRKSLPSHKETVQHKKTSSSPGSSSHLFRQNSSTQYQSGFSVKQSPGSNLNSAKSSSYYYATEPHNPVGTILSRKNSECGANSEMAVGLLLAKNSSQGLLRKDVQNFPTHQKKVSQTSLLGCKEAERRGKNQSSSPDGTKAAKEAHKNENQSKKRLIFNPNINYQKRLQNLLRYESYLREQNESNKTGLENEQANNVSPRVELLYNQRGKEVGSSNILINPTKSWIQINNYLGGEAKNQDDNQKEIQSGIQRKAEVFQAASSGKIGFGKNPVSHESSKRPQAVKGKSANEKDFCSLDMLTNHDQIIHDLKAKKLSLLDLAKLMKENRLFSFQAATPTKSSATRPVSARINKSMKGLEGNDDEDDEKNEEPKGSAKGNDVERNFKYLLNNVSPESLWPIANRTPHQSTDKRPAKPHTETAPLPERQHISSKLEELFGINMKVIEGAKKNKKLQELSRQVKKGVEPSLRERRNTVDDVNNYKSDQLKQALQNPIVISVISGPEEDGNQQCKGSDLHFMFRRMQKVLDKYREREKSWEKEKSLYKKRISVLESLLREKTG